MIEEAIEMDYRLVARLWYVLESVLGIEHRYLACRAALESVENITDAERDLIAAQAVALFNVEVAQ